ncbi:MAG: hypothetical protein AB1721_01285 [Patescibacteria group bacterium]
MKIFIQSLTGLVDVLVLLGYKTITGVCQGGACSFSKGDITLMVPEFLLLWGPLIVLNTIGVGTFLFCRQGDEAMIKRL